MTQSIKKINHKHKKTVDVSKGNKTDTVKTIDKSRSAKRTNIVNTLYKSRSIPGNNLSNRSAIIENPTEIYIVRDNKYFSDFSLQGDDLAVITPDILRIPRKNKRKTPDTSIIRK